MTRDPVQMDVSLVQSIWLEGVFVMRLGSGSLLGRSAPGVIPR